MSSSDQNISEFTRKGSWWSRAEHEIFIQAYEAHGKNWKKIAELVETRNVSQVRSHAQKYFMKLERRSAREQARLKKASMPTVQADLPKLISLAQGQSPEKLVYENHMMRSYIQTIANVNLAFFREFQKLFGEEVLGVELQQHVLQTTAWNMNGSNYPFHVTFAHPYA